MNIIENVPNLFIIGAPKCGTTSLFHYLGEHPSIFSCPIKEPHFFNKDSKHRYYYDLDEYLALFQSATEQQYYRMEASVWYLYSEIAIKEILKVSPNAKFIIMLRDPISMFLSLHQQLLYSGAEQIKNVKKAWDAQEKRRLLKEASKSDVDVTMLQYGKVLSLGNQVARVTQHLTKDQLFLIFLEDVAGNPKRVYESVLEFLGLASHSLKFKAYNTAKKRKSSVLMTATAMAVKSKEILGLKKFRFGLAKKINDWNILDIDHRNQRDILEIRDYIGDYFNEDITLLETHTEKKLTHWKYL
ncbi:MAG: sulfotransferase [Marinirhabdus sp.]|nr:sulfotransferase [Marinirhabdus sp.]